MVELEREVRQNGVRRRRRSIGIGGEPRPITTRWRVIIITWHIS